MKAWWRDVADVGCRGGVRPWLGGFAERWHHGSMSYRAVQLPLADAPDAVDTPTTTPATNKMVFLAFFALLGVGAVLHARRRVDLAKRRVKGGIAIGRAIAS